MQTVFTDKLCIECDACVDICPMDCITFTQNEEEAELRQHLSAPALNKEQDLYVSGELETGRVMVKDEDLCLHCGLCAERCPTNAWDMQKSVLHLPQLGSYAHDALQRFRHQVRQRQRLGFGERERHVRESGVPDGSSGRHAQHFPVEHPGAADVVRSARQRSAAISAAATASTSWLR